MEAMHGLLGHNIDPAIGHAETAVSKVELKMMGIGSNMSVNLGAQLGHGGGKLVNIGNRLIRGVSTGIIFLGPLLPVQIVVTDLVTLREEFAIKSRQILGLQFLVVNVGRKP